MTQWLKKNQKVAFFTFHITYFRKQQIQMCEFRIKLMQADNKQGNEAFLSNFQADFWG